MLPNLIVIGGMKCGTTSLHYYLRQHPEIWMSTPKELNYFVGTSAWSRGPVWYESHFPKPLTVRGESSPLYTSYPRVTGVPERMARVVPGARLVYLVRDPIARLLSDHRSALHVLGIEQSSLQEALADPERSGYVSRSRYAMQLGRYLDHFPLDRILVVDLAELEKRRAETLRRVFSFLGVDETFESPRFAITSNATDRMRPNRAGAACARALDRLIGMHRTHALRKRIPRSLLRPLARRPAPPRRPENEALPQEAVEILREDAARFRALTGMPFVHWPV